MLRKLLACGLMVTVLGAWAAWAADAVSVSGGAATINPQNSRIQFICAHVGAKPDPRKGSFAKFTGKAVVEGKSLKSISFDIDATSVSTEFEKLTTHLKSPDFFDVRRFPTAKFESTRVSPGTGNSQITGNLTLHGVTKEITIPAQVEVSDAGLKLNSEFSIQRLDYGINYDPKKVEDKVALTVVVGEKP
jgi:polyisoprenoid-binding protein YceI